jgi:hypothetical protein
MAEAEYRRLTRSRARTAVGIVSVGRNSLWLAKDHLLCIDTSGYTETYKRFYLRDIQAITVRQTNGWIYAGLVIGLVFAGLGLIALAWGRREPVAGWIFGTLAALLGLIAAIHFARGPTCVTHLRTAVQTEQLASINRMHQARRILRRLRPLIAEVQGQIVAEEVTARLKQFSGAGLPVHGEGGVVAPSAAQDPNSPPAATP